MVQDLSGVEEQMFPPKILDLSRLHTRPSKRPSSYEEHKANLKKLWRQRQKQMQDQSLNSPKDIDTKLPTKQVNIC